MDTTQPLYTVAQIRQIEADFEAQYPNAMPLMQRAGNVIGAHIESLLQRNFLREECLKTPEIRASSGILFGKINASPSVARRVSHHAFRTFSQIYWEVQGAGIHLGKFLGFLQNCPVCPAV